MARTQVTMLSATTAFVRIVLEVFLLSGLMTLPIGFVGWSPGFVASSSCFSAALTHPRSRVFVAIFSSNFTVGRVVLMGNSILNNTLFDTDFLNVVIVFPRRHGPMPGKYRSISAPCPSDIRRGLCCRLDWAMRLFLKENSSWFLRAIDDSWFNPHNLQVFVQQLESFLDPWFHVVMKSHNSPLFNDKWNVAFMQGGAPTLMSHAAVRHSLSTWLDVCGSSHWDADDLALTLIANRSFPSPAAWGDVRFAGATSPSPKTKFREEWSTHRPTYFQFFNVSCSAKSHYLKPLRIIIGVHSWGGIVSWRKLVEEASSSWFPESLLLEFPETGQYQMCLNKSQALLLASYGYLTRVTPLLELQDPRLNFSAPALFKWGFEHIPQLPWLPQRPYGLGVSRRE
jgi:hypothetical protein